MVNNQSTGCIFFHLVLIKFILMFFIQLFENVFDRYSSNGT